ncbi:MAG TPA: hypothetical protein VKE22_11420 [Haliangiales bacterium]|nr:hypothetical protein [Haliangiales bacterium]
MAQANDPKTGAGRGAAVMERGMEKYLAGDLLGAICEWEHALTLDAGLARAREYIDYVRENFDALTREFDAAREAQRLADEAGISDLTGEEESFAEVISQPGRAAPAPLDDALSVVNAGLEQAGVEEPTRELSHEDIEFIDYREEAPREPTSPGRLPAPPQAPAPPMLEPLLEIDLPPPEGRLSDSHDDPDEPRTGPRYALREEEAPEATFTAPSFADEAPTRDFYATPLDIGYEEMTIERQADDGDDGAETRDDRDDARGDPDRTSDFQPGRDLAKKLKEEEVRGRVSELLRMVKESADRGDFRGAVETAEMASAADPDGLVSPVLLHRHRDLLYRVYEGHLGDLKAVPLVAIPLHEISAQNLDHRTGFLLSRIDGMLTFEDILDVAGMPRMEAYQILSALLRKGVIEVR